ncbi:MAG: MFS transporter [Rhodothermia bacterium]|nr:MAG: MFS transporter [Rhodothermia bacterium]
MSRGRAETVDKKTVRSWIFYDFANSSFTTIIVTFIYARYFSEVIASEGNGLSQWGFAISVSAVIIAIISPFLGVMADSGGHRKRFLFISTVISIAGSVVMFFPLPGEVFFALATFVVANVAFEMANVFYNAYLPDIAPLDKIGQISGNGWAVGYLGGLLCLIVGYYIFVAPETPPFGLSAESGSNVRATTLLVAAWFALFSIPMFLWVRDEKIENPPPMAQLLKAAGSELVDTFREIRRFKNAFRLLVARLFYNDGLITIFALVSIYAGNQFGIDPFVLGISLNVAAGAGAFAMGYVDDRIGGKKTILISIVGLSIASFVAVVTYEASLFWAALVLGALLAGPNQASSRSLFGRFVPDNRENEFFGFYAFSGKFTSFLGPTLVGWFTIFFASERVGFSSVIVLFVIGGVILLGVNEKEGMRAVGKVKEI